MMHSPAVPANYRRLIILVAVALLTAGGSTHSEAKGRGKNVSRSHKKRAAAKSKAEADRAEELYLEGAALYHAGKYRAAIEKLTAAYQVVPVPNLLYNIGRCYEALGRLKEALDHYRRCSIDNRAAPAARKKARKRAALLKTIMRKAKAAAADERADRTPSGRAPSGRAPSDRAPSGRAPSDRAQTPPAASRGDGRGSQSPGPRIEIVKSGVEGWHVAKNEPRKRSGAVAVFKWISGIAALGLAGGGAAAFLLGKQDHDRVQNAMDRANGGIIPMSLAEAKSLVDDGDTKKVIGYALWGAGAAAFVLSTVLFIVDGSSSEQPQVATWRLSPIASPLAGGGLVGIGGHF